MASERDARLQGREAALAQLTPALAELEQCWERP
jgi:hypothetical protein